MIKYLLGRAQWRQAFAQELLSLRPDISPEYVDSVSDTEYDMLSGVPPERAAFSYARDCLPLLQAG